MAEAQREVPDEASSKAVIAQSEDDAESTASTAPVFSCDSQDTLCSSEDFGSEAVAAPFSPLETLLFFDWDDTLLPTTWLMQQGLLKDKARLNEEQKLLLQQVAERSAALLAAAKQYGKVVIVTNAQDQWVEMSCRKFVPGLEPVLEDLTLVSARSLFEEPGVWTPSMWKTKAFHAQANAFFSDQADGLRRNILAFGDATHEMEALANVAASMPDCRAKGVKFMERPRPPQLIEECELLLEALAQFVEHDGNLDFLIGPEGGEEIACS